MQRAWAAAQRAAVRLLPERPDHAGRGAAGPHAEAERPGHRSRHGGQHLPLRHLPAHPRRHQDRGDCGKERGHEPHRKRQPPPVPRRHALDRRLRARGAGAAEVRVRRRIRASARAPQSARRSTRASISASRPTARSSSSRTGPRWAPASAPRCRSSSPTSSMPTGASSASSRALGDTKYGDQNTDGSRSIRDFYDAFRRAGAAARVDAGERRRRAAGRCRPPRSRSRTAS